MVKKKETRIKFVDRLLVEKEKINDDLARYAELQYKFGLLVNAQKEQVKEIKDSIEAKESSIIIQYKNKYKNRKEIKITNDDAKMYAKAHPEIQELKQSLRAAEKKLDDLNLKKDTLRSKNENLKQISENYRAELYFNK